MIKVSVLYPNDPGVTFDMGYYCDSHVPMVRSKLGDSCRNVAVEEGVVGGQADAPATYVAMGHLYFDSVEAFQDAFAPHADTILGDVPNYTNVQPLIQISRVRI